MDSPTFCVYHCCFCQTFSNFCVSKEIEWDLWVRHHLPQKLQSNFCGVKLCPLLLCLFLIYAVEKRIDLLAVFEATRLYLLACIWMLAFSNPTVSWMKGRIEAAHVRRGRPRRRCVLGGVRGRRSVFG